MPTYRTKVDSDSQITLPGALVERLGIHEGSEVEFFLMLDGDVFFHAVAERAKGWRSLFPTARRSPRLSIREMDEGMVEGMVEDDEGIRSGAAEVPAPGKGRSAAE